MPVWAGDFLSNRRTLLTGGVDRTIRRWDAETGSAANPPERGAEGPLAPICRRYLRDMFGTRYVRAIHGLLLTAWSMAGIFGPVAVNYIRKYNVTHGVAPAQAYNVTMYVMAGLLVIGFI